MQAYHRGRICAGPEYRQRLVPTHWLWGRGQRQGPDVITACRCACLFPVCETGRGPDGGGLREEWAVHKVLSGCLTGAGSLAKGRQSADAVPEVRWLPPGLG